VIRTLLAGARIAKPSVTLPPVVTRFAMSRELRNVPPGWSGAPGPPGVAFEGPGRTAAELVPSFAAAYPPGHPDFDPTWDLEAEQEKILSGRECGPLLGCSRFAVADEVVVGAILITLPQHGRAAGAPLIADVFRHPDAGWRGLGRALLRRGIAAAAADGHTAINLLVTEGNQAQQLYESLGFAVVARIER
jgi:GNAT superfamily N-acetyltransferase